MPTNKTPLKFLSIIVLSLLLIVYNAFFITYAIQKHAALQTAGFDLGNHSQAMRNTLLGHPLAITTMQNITSRWALHFEPTLLLLTPIYALSQQPQTLLIIQVIIVTLGAIPIFFIARQNLTSDIAGIVFALVYLFFPALQGALIFDFHAVTLAATFLSAALWCLHWQRYRLLLVAVILAMGCKENIPLLVLMMGGYIWLVQKQPKWGISTMGLAAFWFILANFVIIPFFSPIGENIHLHRYTQWGDSMGQVIVSLITRPLAVLGFIFSGDRLNYWLRLTMPVAFTALLDPLILLIALPEMFINTLSSYPPTYQLDRFHYSIIIVPFITVAGINGVARLVRWIGPKLRYARPKFLQNTLLGMILIVTLAYQLQFGHTPIGRYFEWPVITAHHRQAQEMLALIPPEAAVAAQNNLVPHISQRAWIFVLPKRSQQGQQAEYIAIDMSSPLYPYDFIETYCADIQTFLERSEYGLIYAEQDLLLFKRNAPNATTYTPRPPCLN